MGDLKYRTEELKNLELTKHLLRMLYSKCKNEFDENNFNMKRISVSREFLPDFDFYIKTLVGFLGGNLFSFSMLLVFNVSFIKNVRQYDTFANKLSLYKSTFLGNISIDIFFATLFIVLIIIVYAYIKAFILIKRECKKLDEVMKCGSTSCKELKKELVEKRDFFENYMITINRTIKIIDKKLDKIYDEYKVPKSIRSMGCILTLNILYKFYNNKDLNSLVKKIDIKLLKRITEDSINLLYKVRLNESISEPTLYFYIIRIQNIIKKQEILNEEKNKIFSVKIERVLLCSKLDNIFEDTFF